MMSSTSSKVNLARSLKDRYRIFATIDAGPLHLRNKFVFTHENDEFYAPEAGPHSNVVDLTVAKTPAG